MYEEINIEDLAELHTALFTSNEALQLTLHKNKELTALNVSLAEENASLKVRCVKLQVEMLAHGIETVNPRYQKKEDVPDQKKEVSS